MKLLEKLEKIGAALGYNEDMAIAEFGTVDALRIGRICYTTSKGFSLLDNGMLSLNEEVVKDFSDDERDLFANLAVAANNDLSNSMRLHLLDVCKESLPIDETSDERALFIFRMYVARAFEELYGLPDAEFIVAKWFFQFAERQNTDVSVESIHTYYRDKAKVFEMIKSLKPNDSPEIDVESTKLEAFIKLAEAQGDGAGTGNHCGEDYV